MEKSFARSSSMDDPSSSLPVDPALDFEDALDDSLESSGNNLFACNSPELPASLKGWELLPDGDEVTSSDGRPFFPPEPPFASAAEGGKTERVNFVDMSEPAAQDSSKVFLHRAAFAPPAVVSEAIRLTDKRPLLYPWEKGRLGRVFNNVGRLDNKKPRLHPGANNFVQVNMEVAEGLKCESSLSVAPGVYNPAIYAKAVKQMVGCSYVEERVARREHAIKQWWDLLRYDLKHSDPGRVAVAEHGLADIYKYGTEVLDACFGLKSPNTLLKRLYAIKLFNLWLMREMSMTWIPLKEHMVWAYLRHLKDTKAPASRATSLLESIRFCHFTMRVEGATEVMDSLRVRGLAAQLYINKKPWRPSDVFTVSEIEFLHECFADSGRSDVNRVIVGHLLHLLYARARHSDLLAVTDCFLDEEGAFFEVGTTIHKSARNMDTKSKLLPVVAVACGVRGGNWARAYLQLRAQVGLPLPKDTPIPMMPAPGRVQGGWCERYLTPQELNVFIKSLFDSAGRPIGKRKLTTHSFKATSLSWCAKHGVPAEQRSILARHTVAAQGATVLYSRDIISAAMRCFVSVIESIRSALFHPDKTRSGMLTSAPQTPAFAPRTPAQTPAACETKSGLEGSVDLAPQQSGDAGECNEEEYTPGTPVEMVMPKEEVSWPDVDLGNGVIDLEAPKLLSRPWDSESESESSSSDSEGSELDCPVEGNADQAESAEMPVTARWFINAKTLVIHERRNANSFKCGRVVSATYFAVPALNGLRCGKCFAHDL